MRFRNIAFFTIAALLAFSAPSYAQDPQPQAQSQTQPQTQPATTGLPDRIIRPMQPVDPVTLRAEGVSIRLWGIRPAQTSETPLELKGLDLMDSLTASQIVNCKIVGGSVPELVGQCQNQSNEDLALSLLESGYAVVDRRQTYNTVLATGYAKAQETARLKARGVWKFLTDADSQASPVPKWLQPHLGVLLPVALLFGPFAGLALMALVMHLGLRRISAKQDSEIEEARRKEAGLQSRERLVLVSTLEGELTDNKHKIDAFQAIYGDMLQSLKAGGAHKYQQSGDIVQKHPAFSKTVFEASVGRLSLLDVKTAGMVSKLYAALPKDQEYINLEPDVPLDTAVKLVEKVLNDAKTFQPGIEQAIKSLQSAGQKQE